MTKEELTKKVQELRELTRMADELAAEIEAVKDAIKEEMNESNNYELHGTDYKITWREYSTSRIDSKALKKDLPEIAEKYTKETKSRRFLLA
jgi:predicted phage-related endonuclease